MMVFFNSLSIRIPLAIIGGILYCLLTYNIVNLLDLTSEIAIQISIIVFLFYVGSRFLILFSGFNTPYYSKRREEVLTNFIGKDSFHQTAQWVGKFYHYHDIALFAFLGILSVFFLITLVVDGLRGNLFGSAIQALWNALLFFY